MLEKTKSRVTQETRMYCMVNMYMSGIHAGIQSAHAITETLIACNGNSLLRQWATSDKTIIVLDGGYQSNLLDIYGAMKFYGLCARSEDVCPLLPFAKFHEEESALNSALTCVAIVLPDWMYNCRLITEACGEQRLIIEEEGMVEEATHLFPYEIELLKKIKACSLKRG